MDLNALKIFIRVADTQSFTKAAELVGLTQSGVSRAIARLEQELHVVLLNRNTHTLSLTPDGLFLYESSKHLIHDMEEVGQVLSGRTLFPEGILKSPAQPSQYCISGFPGQLLIGYCADQRFIGFSLRSHAVAAGANSGYQWGPFR